MTEREHQNLIERINLALTYFESRRDLARNLQKHFEEEKLERVAYLSQKEADAFNNAAEELKEILLYINNLQWLAQLGEEDANK